MTYLLKFSLSPGGLITMLVVLQLMAGLRPQWIWLRRLRLLVLFTTFAMCLWPVAYLASRPLASQYGPLTTADVSTGRTAIVLLGAGHGVTRDWDNQPHPSITETATERIAEAARVYRMSADAVIISSGGGDAGTVWTDASVMQRELANMGVPPDRIIPEDASANTREQATRVAELLRHLNVTRVVLVTSELHMTRSIGTFRAAGVAAAPAVARESWPRRRWVWLTPSGAALQYVSAVLHEYLGIAMYAARGWYK